MANKRGNPNWTNGRSGNPNGRPKSPIIAEFNAAIAEVEKEKKKTLFKHFIEQGYKDKNVLIAVLRKRVPDLTSVEMSGIDGGPIEVSESTKKMTKEQLDKRIKLLLGK